MSFVNYNFIKETKLTTIFVGPLSNEYVNKIILFQNVKLTKTN